MHLVLRFVGIVLIRVFYRAIVITHLDRIPAGRPVILVANHPNGLLDPLVVRIALGRPMAFLAKSTLFGNALGRAAMKAFDAIPVFRSKDGADTSKNDATFLRCYELLGAGGALMLFPEGVSHSDPALKPLKTGAARIALGAAASGLEGVTLVPLGLLYEDKGIFRTTVAGTIGAPIELGPYLEQRRTDDRGAVEALTAKLHEALSEVVLQATSHELWNGFVAVAAWTADDGGRDLERREARARELARAYAALVERDPTRAAAIVGKARKYARTLRFLGVTDPFALEDATSLRPSSFASFLAPIAALSPLALVGLILNWLPYRLTGILAARVTKETDLLGTMKALIGLVLFLVTWLLEGTLVGHFLGTPAGLLTFFLGPLAGDVAIRWLERLQLRREALRSWWLRSTRARLVDELRARRSALRSEIDSTLRERVPPSPNA